MRIDSNNVSGNYSIYTSRANQTQKQNENQEVKTKQNNANLKQASPDDVLNALTAYGNYNMKVINSKINSFASSHQTSVDRISNNTQLIESLYDELASMGLSDGAINIVFDAYFA